MKRILKLISSFFLRNVYVDMVKSIKPYKEVFEEAQAGHDLHIVSHNDYFVGKFPPV